MDNPDSSDRTVINVKGVRKSAWQAAKRGASQLDDSMGTWLSDAIDQRISRDANAVQAPANKDARQDNPDALTPDQLTARILAVAALQQSAAALKQARIRGTGKAMLSTAQAGLVQRMIEAEGEPPRQIAGKAVGQEWSIVGQSGTKMG